MFCICGFVPNLVAFYVPLLEYPVFEVRRPLLLFNSKGALATLGTAAQSPCFGALLRQACRVAEQSQLGKFFFQRTVQTYLWFFAQHRSNPLQLAALYGTNARPPRETSQLVSEPFATI
jgi:hypothetical protein